MSATVRSLSLIPGILIGFLSLFLAVPLFIFAYHRIPNLDWPYHSDKILVFILIITFLLLIVRAYKYVVFTGVVAVVGWLWFGSISGTYGFKEFFEDGKDIIYGMGDSSKGRTQAFTGSRALTTDREILRAIEYKNPLVRDFAVGAANEYFGDNQQEEKMKYRILIQCFAVFKKINENWNYVSDPQDDEYIAKASESVKLLAGDCDDHSILMAAATKAIGGRPRLVYTRGHIYPELYVGSKRDLDHISRLIHEKLFQKESHWKTIHYHRDENGNVWLNLDYTAGYPGGKFIGDEVIECIYP